MFADAFDGGLFSEEYRGEYLIYPFLALYAGAVVIASSVWMLSRAAGTLATPFAIIPAMLTVVVIFVFSFLSIPRSGMFSGSPAGDMITLPLYLVGLMVCFSLPAWLHLAAEKWVKSKVGTG